VIRAEVHTDDHKVYASFDATPFFEQATLDQVVALKAIDWGGDYQADAVALFMLGKDPEVGLLFRYLELVPPGSDGYPLGFECRVDEEDVLRWVRANRPDWLQLIGQAAPAHSA
jgi:hypothetical protein